jgi:hypothetical protein
MPRPTLSQKEFEELRHLSKTQLLKVIQNHFVAKSPGRKEKPDKLSDAERARRYRERKKLERMKKSKG